ncbi:head maturation protease, ClpP-related [[Actinomadura] parvosata]|uniref:head maturation protease, ClpP-related n=1 Tax=[Actinomadura] parvosata TaxID=1955412 RepID=UPI00406D2044
MSWIETVADAPRPGFKAQLREKHTWYEIKNAASDEAELLLFDEIGGWYGIYADEFMQDLKRVTAPKLTVRINSPGGSVFEGIAVANALRVHPAEVTTRVEGLAASIASVIALAGDRLVMMPQATLMIHEASGACLGNAADMAKMAEVLDLLSDNIADAYADKAGGSREQWREAMRKESWYTADEAVAAGLADEVLRDAKPVEAVTDRAWDLSVFMYSGRAAAPAPVITPAAEPVQAHEAPTHHPFDAEAFRAAVRGAFT